MSKQARSVDKKKHRTTPARVRPNKKSSLREERPHSNAYQWLIVAREKATSIVKGVVVVNQKKLRQYRRRLDAVCLSTRQYQRGERV